ITVTAKVKDGFKFGTVVPKGWTKNDDGTMTFTKTVDRPTCAVAQGKRPLPRTGAGAELYVLGLAALVAAGAAGLTASRRRG
ncbi:MAG: LPXTG cell wall anchor domain-containing protein, partial [Propionibacteriaceae bacterium]|nr:LPXTG cell wall anchor domain-containing protein [Propionibacteriaceae bacterium]